MVFKNDNEVLVECNCGCSYLKFEWAFGNLWVSKLVNDSPYVSDNKISKKCKDLIKIARKKPVVDNIYLDRNSLVEFVSALRELRDEAKLDALSNDIGYPFDSNTRIFVGYESDTDLFSIDLCTNFSAKEILTGRISFKSSACYSFEQFNKIVKNFETFLKKYE